MKRSLSFMCLLLGIVGGVQADTALLPATANAGLSSIYEESARKKPDQQGWSWRGNGTLALRQNQNWSKFEAKTILLKFDTTRIRGWTVKEAFLHLALAKDDLYGVGACTVLADWQEGRLDGQREPGAPSWNYRAGPETGEPAAERRLWAWPGSAFYSVAWLHPALRYSHAGPDRITRTTDAQGVRWLKIPVEPALVHAMAIGASYGLVITDDKGQVAEAHMLEKNPKPYVYDPSFEIEVYSRHAKDGTLAPKLEVTGEASDRVPPAAPKAARAEGTAIELVAPGDDGMTGCAQAYRVRYSEKAITDANWAQAAEVPRYALPLPRPGGEKQFLHLMTLRPGAWHVAIRAVDEAGNEGPPCDVEVKVPDPSRRRFVEVKGADPKGVNGWSFDGKIAVWAASDQWKVDPLVPAAQAAPWKGREVDGRKDPGAVRLKAARNEVAAFQLVLERQAGAVGDVKVTVSDLQGPGAVIPAAKHVELFREWYFATDGGAGWAPDACLPLAAPLPQTLQIPALDNVGEAQRNQAVWIDLYVPKTAAPGEYRGTITLTTPALKEPAVINLALTVRALTLPDEITWPIELNTYGGIGAFAGVDIAREPERYLKVERSYYQLAHKHRCTLNILRYRHSGAITENGAPPLAGEGAARSVADWSAWDARFGPYLDGSAFTEASGYYGPGMGTPLTHFYLPCHESWPMDLDRYYADRAEFPDRAAFAEWAKKSRRLDETLAPEYAAGYEKVVGEMVRHFAEKRWTRTAFQFFLNNKYYYKCPFFVEPGLGMSGHGNGRCYWLLDEPIDFDDMDANRFFLSLGREAVKESGVRDLRLHFRTDVSYPQMTRGLWDGVCNLWCSSALGEVAATARIRREWMPGEEWSTYGAGITVSDPAVKQLQVLLNRYCLGAVYVLPYWTNFGAGWRKADDLSIFYPGAPEAVGGKTFDAPVAGLRMKLLRRAQQDVEYLNLLARSAGWDRDQVAEALAVWADAPATPTGPDFNRLTPARAAQLRDAVAATIPPEYDARFVGMEVPKQVLTDQVFTVKITMKNAGSKAWDGSAHAHLHSQDPPDNMTWGTRFIHQGQGTSVAPGAEKVYQSQLRAPAVAGEYSFQWQLTLPSQGAFFGEPTARAVIKVEKRPESPPVARPSQDANEKRVLSFDDFEYAGSFRPPCGTWTETGLAFRRMKDGTQRLFVNEKGIREIEVPPLVKFDGTNFASLRIAEVKKVWGDLGIKVPKAQDVERVGPNAGFWWDEAKRTLYWTWYHGYWTGGPLPVLGASRLADDGTITTSGPWTVPGMKHHWGGVIGLSKAFADKYTDGRTLAMGFGGYYSICAPCSRGPALGAIAEPDPAKQAVDLVPLLAYSGGAAAPRDGDYFFGCGGFWNDAPESPREGHWAFDDWCRSGVFIDLPDKHGYVAFVKLGTGRIGYDYGSITSGGTSHYWYFYDPKDLGEVAKGRVKAALVPHSMAKVTYPGNNGGAVSAILGACFDPEEKRLYLYKPFGFQLSRTEQPPLIHVYKIK